MTNAGHDRPDPAATPRPNGPDPVPPQPASGQGQGQALHVKIDEQKMQSSYANAFRTHTTAEEVMLDFGVNLVTPRPDGKSDRSENQLLFQVNDRVILNYYTVKRLAIALSQIVRQHEDQFGELQLNPQERAKRK